MCRFWVKKHISVSVCLCAALKVADEVKATRNVVLCLWIYSDRLIKKGFPNMMGLAIAVRFTSVAACVLGQRGFTSMNKLM